MVEPSGASSGKGLGTKPGSTKDELQAALKALYGDMEKDPTAEIPWAVHILIENLKAMVNPEVPVPQQTGMEKHVGQQDGTNLKQRVAVFLSTRNGKVLLSDVHAAFPGESQSYINQVLRKIKKGEVKIPSQVEGVTYRASGGKGFVVVERLNTNLNMPPGRKPGRTIDRVLLFLYHSPVATDSDIAGYAETDEARVKGFLSRLRGYGFIDINRSLTETGKVNAERLGSGKRGESFLSRFGKYLAGQEGKDIDYSSVRTAFPDEKSTTVRMYFQGFVSGKHSIEGYRVINVDENRIRVERLAAAQPEIPVAAPTIETGEPHPVAPSSGGQADYQRKENERLYAGVAGSIEDVYREFPELERLIGDRKGFENTVLKARNSVRPGRVGDFYETVRKIPRDHELMGNPHNHFFKLVIEDPDSAYRMMTWTLQRDGITAETFMEEIGKYKPALARQP